MSTAAKENEFTNAVAAEGSAQVTKALSYNRKPRYLKRRPAILDSLADETGYGFDRLSKCKKRILVSCAKQTLVS